jgi:hypothetical protein
MIRARIRFVLCLPLICSTAAVIPASAQHFEQMEGALTQVAAGRNEVWGLDGSEIYRFNANSKKFAKIKGSLAQIAVGGGTLTQLDEVWGINSSGDVYRYDFSTKSLVFIAGGKECPTCFPVAYSQIAAGPGYEDSCHPYEIWGLNNFGTVRYNYCSSQFDTISNPSGISFAQIATAGGDVWALSPTSGTKKGVTTNVWEYAPAYDGWFVGGFSVGDSLEFTQITVGVNDVWGISKGAEGQACWFPWAPSDYISDMSGGCWLTAQVATGGDGVWAIYSISGANGLIARWDFQQAGFSSPFSLTSPALQIAVGSGAGVWAVDSSDRVYTFVRP